MKICAVTEAAAVFAFKIGADSECSPLKERVLVSFQEKVRESPLGSWLDEPYHGKPIYPVEAGRVEFRG